VDGRVNANGDVELLLATMAPRIPRNQWERIFEKFTTAEHGETQKNFGLGLWGLKTFFRRQGGDVFIAASDDEKTTFVCKSGPVRWRNSVKGKILHLEDDPEWIEHVRALLGDRYDLHSVTNLEEAAQRVIEVYRAGDRFDLAICDINLQVREVFNYTGLPNRHGLEFLDLFRRF
jgi:hypothetical protein